MPLLLVSDCRGRVGGANRFHATRDQTAAVNVCVCACKTAGTWRDRRRRRWREWRRDESGGKRTAYDVPFSICGKPKFHFTKDIFCPASGSVCRVPGRGFRFDVFIFQSTRVSSNQNAKLRPCVFPEPFTRTSFFDFVRTLLWPTRSRREVRASFKFTEGQARPSPPFKIKDSLSTA